MLVFPLFCIKGPFSLHFVRTLNGHLSPVLGAKNGHLSPHINVLALILGEKWFVWVAITPSSGVIETMKSPHTLKTKRRIKDGKRELSEQLWTVTFPIIHTYLPFHLRRLMNEEWYMGWQYVSSTK